MSDDEARKEVGTPNYSIGGMRGMQKDRRIDADVAKDEADPKASHLGLPRLPGEGTTKYDVNELFDRFMREDY